MIKQKTGTCTKYGPRQIAFQRIVSIFYVSYKLINKAIEIQKCRSSVSERLVIIRFFFCEMVCCKLARPGRYHRPAYFCSNVYSHRLNPIEASLFLVLPLRFIRLKTRTVLKSSYFFPYPTMWGRH